MSRRHATLRRTAVGWEIVDAESANGTWCDGLRVTRHLLASGQNVRVGETVFAFEDAEPAAAGVAAPATAPRAPRRRRTALWLGGALSIGCLSLVILSAGGWIAVRSARARRAETASAASAAAAFRQQAARDYRRALASLATPDAGRSFAQLDEALWPATQPRVGWAWFFGTSLVCVGGPVEGGTLVGFYNPWADVFVLGLWSPDERGGARLVEAEVLLGEYVRRRGRPPFQAERLWMRRDVYRPAAVGLAAAETLRAFEAVFRPSGFARFSPLRRRWRSALPGLDDPQRLEANRYAAGLVLASAFAELAPLYGPATGTPQSVRACLASAFRAARREGLPALAKQARETPIESTRALAALRPGSLDQFRAASFLAGSRRSVLLLSMPERPDLYLGLLVSTEGPVSRIARVDLLSFQAFYASGQTLPEGRR